MELLKRQKFLLIVLKYGLLVSTAMMVWKSLKILNNCNSPIIIVSSASMEPAFLRRGDIVFLTNFHQDPVQVGDVVAFNIEDRSIPIIHRVVKLHKSKNDTIKFLTREDGNIVDDRGLYRHGQLGLTRKDIIGKVRGFLPRIGMVVIYMSEYLNFILT